MGVPYAAVLVVGLIVAVTFGKIAYNVFLHPLRRYTGPKWWAASRIPWLAHSIRGDLHLVLRDLHNTYGPAVRIAPNEISYTDPAAWRQIYGHRTVEMSKDFKGAGLFPPMRGVLSIITAPKDDHARIRRAIAPAFSDRALREQESYLQSYISRMLDGIAARAAEGSTDLVAWLNWTTFDITGDLAFGEPFGCLQDADYHLWITTLFDGVRLAPYVQAALYFNAFGLLNWLAPRSMVEAKEQADANAAEKTSRRLARGEDPERKDFMSFILGNNKSEMIVSEAEVQETAGILIIAGSETTATFLAGALSQILGHPHTHQRLVKEIRSTFATESEISTMAVQHLTFANAVIDEAFRTYPPSPAAFPRIVPPSGEEVCGQWVPGGTTVGVPQFAANRDMHNFHRATDFLPERWLPQDKLHDGDVAASHFARDAKQVVQPFSYGPRNCIGKNLAIAEIRLILARLFWRFDIELADKDSNANWILRQKTMLLWDKGSLMVKVTPVLRS